MDSDSWRSNRFSTSSRQRNYTSRSDVYLGGVEEMEDDDDEMRIMEYICPFCAEDFDVVGLCYHIDEEHPVETCPVCTKRVGMDMRKRRFRKGGSNSTFSMLRKELREGNLQSFFGGSSFKFPFNSEPDPLLSSFISNLPQVDESQLQLPAAETGKQIGEDSSLGSARSVEQSPLSNKDQKEASRKCEFVQGLLLSTIFDDV